MAEYMDYNDYDYEYKSKKQKRNANIRFAIAVLFIIFVVVWTITHLPENVRTGFKPVYSSSHKIGEKQSNKNNEFTKFDKAFELNTKVNFDDDFKQKYPEISSLVKTPKLEIAKGKVKTFDTGRHFILASVYEVERQKDANGNYYDDGLTYIVGTTGVDFYVFEYDTSESFIINKPERFSIRLHSKKDELMPTIEKVYVQSESFRLNFYTLSVIVESKNTLTNIQTKLNLESGINKSEFDKNFFTKQHFVKSNENQNLIKTIENIGGGQRGDTMLKTHISLLAEVNYAQVGIEFNDTVYNKFLSFEIPEFKNATYKIKVN